MRIGIICLLLAYGLSQFYRAFLAVLTPYLGAEIGTTPETLATASSLWFVAFAALQIPVGIALDKIGPRRTTALLFGLGTGGGAAIFALATQPWHITVAMTLIGAGCAPVLVSSYYIFARIYSPAVFATLAGAVIAIGSFGNISSSYPLAWALGFLGWRETVWCLAALSVLTAALIQWRVVDPPRVEGSTGSLRDVMAIRSLWPIYALLFVSYAPVAAISGLWVGPYTHDIFGLDAAGIGASALVIGVSIAVGSLLYGPAERLLRSRKFVAMGGSAIMAVALLVLSATAGQSLALSIVLFACVGFFGANFPVLMAHGRGFLPPHLTGRGVTFMNLFSIGGVGILQFTSGRVFGAIPPQPATAPYAGIFLMFGLIVAVGVAIYAFSREGARNI
ncbi:MFS transporter [Ketogulonicigenium vulgare]|uniref:Major facilitator superfamily (MFS) transporter n=1 Tax=Ketogulonicigenium vulgare (strain WSH-001) TaxID=759362 RepID=F9Y7Q2_KETVW|nr:MFS transporter [Ketogulonicigenium vulgare]ADO41631.1 major facilitator superfamily protein [Ketogulonicigenium vulgare Y25]AEM39868.1 Major facilitator superfamily (MFS) transporter [Ketogulonicigenium vulgare WSH-001]ALJ80087.1 MFS transporter [Ketogulonicigenium vulgare]ANW32959.1 MFS transporter [Ketogulonicigenium vulgare]AOZ53562.1 major facilitator superfamily protein [Ketogulonicigenium vulgare]